MGKADHQDLVVQKLSFEDLKKINQHGIEYWSARSLQSLLGYAKWQRFENAIEKAIGSCRQSGNDPKHHFTGAGNPITTGKGRSQVVKDYHLSRFACYLIAQTRKGIDPKEQLMDRMDRTELAANQFRMTQMREKLKREGIKNQRDAIEAHETVGKEVRAAIAKIGGTPPENIPPAEHIKKVEKRLKKTKPKLLLDDRDCGLLPNPLL